MDETVAVRIEDDEVQSVVEKLRGFAQDNPGVVLGALHAFAVSGPAAKVQETRKVGLRTHPTNPTNPTYKDRRNASTCAFASGASAM